MTDQDHSRPSGTVYGRGGADIRGGGPGGLPRAFTAGVGAGVVAVLGLGWAAWSSTAGGDSPPAAAAAAGPPTGAPEPDPTTPDPAKVQLTTGSWLLSPLGDPDTYLTVNGDDAKMSPADPATLTVVAGLADDSCFSFRVADGRYLRHFDYRLRFDASDDSDLFRADATFCQEAGTDVGTVRLRSENYPEHLVHRRDDGSLYIDKPEGSGFTAESSFMVQAPS
ncbi:AbfB domain-containing protein [Actinoplanes sp. NPDC023801]|uniref:AbfB domain-containing protein n=1 Tax=Actinoplanes sp. NPDC023801 TaxID=3154595 RepID=UPI0033DA0FCF